MKHLLTLNRYLYKYKGKLLLGVLFVALSTYFKILQPQMIREGLDLVFHNLDTFQLLKGTEPGNILKLSLGKLLLLFAAIVIVLAIIMGIFMYYTRQTIIVVSRLIEYDLRKELFAHYTELDQAFYQSHKTGDLMARITEDVSKVRNYLGPAILYGLNLFFLFVMVIYTMFTVNVTLSIWVLVPLPFLSISIYYVSDIINRKSTIIQKQLSFVNSLAQEFYSGIRVIKSYAKETPMKAYFYEECEDYREKSLDLAQTNAFFMPLMMLMIGISTIITVYVGGLQVIKGAVTPGNVAEFVIYVNMLTWPVTSIGWIASLVQQAEASMQRLNEFLEQEPEIKNPESGQRRKIEGNIVFEHVSFTYKDSEVRALQDISMQIDAGQKIGIVGKTASGKTTIADLLMRMYDPTEGEIYLDGVNLKNWDLGSLRSQIGYVPQDHFLFSDSIENNIAIAAGDVTSEKVVEFAGHASVREDIEGMSEAYETMIGERGVSLSGGQKQRVSIARALIREPSLVIMDDSLSAVDTRTEQQIINYMSTVLAGKTVLMITHRLNILADFDYIYVLEEGRFAEKGTHDGLLMQKGLYYDLFQQQQMERGS